eukprot:1169202-Amphidinium_carterae.1
MIRSWHNNTETNDNDINQRLPHVHLLSWSPTTNHLNVPIDCWLHPLFIVVVTWKCSRYPLERVKPIFIIIIIIIIIKKASELCFAATDSPIVLWGGREQLERAFLQDEKGHKHELSQTLPQGRFAILLV